MSDDAQPVFAVPPEQRVYEHVREGRVDPTADLLLICQTPRRLFDADPRSSTLRACTCGERLLRWTALPSRWRPGPVPGALGPDATLEEVERFMATGLRTEAEIIQQLALGTPPQTTRPAAVDLLIGALRDEIAAAQKALSAMLSLRAQAPHLAPPPPEPPFLSEEHAAWRRLYGDTP